MATRRPPRRITLQVEGDAADAGHVRLSDFIKQLDVLRGALKQTERLHTGSEDSGVYWRVVDLRHESPATVVLEEVRPKDKPTPDRPVVDVLAQALKQIGRAGKLPPKTVPDLGVLESYRALSNLSADHRVAVQIRYAGNHIRLEEKFRDNIEKIIGPDDFLRGSISGMLEAINLHRGYKFNVYPFIGPKRIACEFPPHLKPRVIAALDKYVSVSGTLSYKQWAPFPHAMDVDEIEVHDEAGAPTLSDLRGMAPNATGNLSSEDFIGAIRDGDW